MTQFYTGKELADKLTDIIWNVKKRITNSIPFYSFR